MFVVAFFYWFGYFSHCQLAIRTIACKQSHVIVQVSHLLDKNVFNACFPGQFLISDPIAFSLQRSLGSVLKPPLSGRSGNGLDAHPSSMFSAAIHCQGGINATGFNSTAPTKASVRVPILKHIGLLDSK